MIADPVERGCALAAFHQSVAPSLFEHLAETGLLPAAAPAHAAARGEWDVFSLYACVRGLVAACGFGPETSAAIDALHERVLESWVSKEPDLAAFAARRERMAERYEEYGALARDGGAGGAADLARRLGRAAARHLAGPDAPEALADLAGALHETLAEGAAEYLRRA